MNVLTLALAPVACQWLARDGSFAALRQVLGPASVETTQRYARLEDEAVMRGAQ